MVSSNKKCPPYNHNKYLVVYSASRWRIKVIMATGKRSVGKPSTRWTNDIVKIAGIR